MRELSNILTSAKKVRGNIDFESVDLTVQNDEDENPLQFIERTNEEAEKIIENFMIMANETVATYFYWRDLPFIYRVHNLPDEIKLEKTVELIQAIGSKMIKLQNAYGQKAIQSILKKYEGTPEYSIISNLLLRNMSKAQYSTTNIGHFALALDNYCHFTSPIRRFPDLMIHHLLNIFNKDYSMNNLPTIQERLEQISAHSSYKERQADDAERDYLNFKNFTQNPEKRKRVKDVVDKMKRQIRINTMRHSATMHYARNYGYIPLWILVKVLSFGILCELFSILKRQKAPCTVLGM